MLTKILGLKRKRLIGDWDCMIRNFMIGTKQIFFGFIEHKRMGLAGRVSHVRGSRSAFRIWWRNLKERDH